MEELTCYLIIGFIVAMIMDHDLLHTKDGACMIMLIMILWLPFVIVSFLSYLKKQIISGRFGIRALLQAIFNSKLTSVRSLTIEHSLHMEDGTWKKIKSITNGLYYNSKLITLEDGSWVCLMNSDKIEVKKK